MAETAQGAGLSSGRPQPMTRLDGAQPSSRASNLYDQERRPLGPVDAFHLLRRSWSFISAHRGLVALKCVLALSSMTFFLLTPWPIKIVIDNVIDGRPLTGLPAYLLRPAAGDDRSVLLIVVAAFLALAAILVGMVGDHAVGLSTRVESGGLDQAGFTANEANTGWSLWNGLFGFWETRVTLDLTQRINQDVRTTLYDRFLRSPLSLYADQKIGDAVFRVMHDSASIASVLYSGVLAPAMSLVMILLALSVITAQFSNEPVIVLLAVLALPIIAIGASLFGRALRTQSQHMRERGSDVMAAFEERIAQVQLIKAFGQEHRESRKVDDASWYSYRSALKMLVIVMVLAMVVTPMLGLLVGIGVYHLMLEVIRGNMTLGDVILLGGYGMMLGQPMATLGGTWATLQAPVAGLRRIHSVLDRLGEPDSAGDRHASMAPISKIELRGVSVGYEGAPPVLSNVSLDLRAGEMAALAGPSGSGKTTLISAILGFVPFSSGTELINGIDSSAIGWAEIRRRIGFVFQQEALFSVSIADNIRYGMPAANDSEIRRAAEMAGATDFIGTLPQGYATMLGRRGARLSVGQKQRIAIARALLRQPQALILDEPMAPLDTASEAELIATLKDVACDRIVLVVAHRAQTLAVCDRVFFIDKGTVAAAGPHAELIEKSESYRAYLAMAESEIRR